MRFPKRWRGTGIFLFLVFVAAACSPRDPEPFEFHQVGETMGTTYSVKISKLPTDLERSELGAEIEACLERVNASMSTYRMDSELSQLNQNRSTEWIEISKPLADVIDESLKISVLSDGAYDVTVGPLVNLWGFGPEGPRQTAPDPSDISARRQQTGFRKIHLNTDRTAIRKDVAEIYIDLSSLAKGYGVDQLGELLEKFGIENYLVEVGGELRVKGERPDGGAWNIAIEKPLAGQRAIQQVIHLKDIAVATSGDYRNFFEDRGIRYSHTIDPGTGMPIAHSLASVTVMEKSAMRADALATAFMALGPEAGLKLAEDQQIAALFIVRKGSGFVTLNSPAFPSEAG